MHESLGTAAVHVGMPVCDLLVQQAASVNKSFGDFAAPCFVLDNAHHCLLVNFRLSSLPLVSWLQARGDLNAYRNTTKQSYMLNAMVKITHARQGISSEGYQLGSTKPAPSTRAA